mgnify:CR=1 FL=1
MLESLQLVAPNGSPITGIRAADGSNRKFKYSYDRTTKVCLFVLEDGTEMNSGTGVLVDSNGNAWDSSEVQYYTLFEHRSQ